MWSAISSFISTLAGIFNRWFGIKEEQEKRKTEEFKARNTEEEIRKATIVEEAKSKDSAESLVKSVKDAKTDEEKKERLRKIRIIVGG